MLLKSWGGGGKKQIDPSSPGRCELLLDSLRWRENHTQLEPGTDIELGNYVNDSSFFFFIYSPICLIKTRPLCNYCCEAILASRRRLYIFAVWYANVLQSEEKEDEFFRDEEATTHEIVQDSIKRKFQMNGSGWASQVFFSTWRNWEILQVQLQIVNCHLLNMCIECVLSVESLIPPKWKLINT